MLIYGLTPVQIDTVQTNSTSCPRCDEKNSVVLNAYRRHTHLFWIPMFPLRKKVEVLCGNCGYVFDKKSYSVPLKIEFENFKNASKGPYWQFSGVALILVGLAWGKYSSNQDKKRELSYVTSPQKNDVYEYEIVPGSYSTFRVGKVTKDSLFVYYNVYEIDRSSQINSIDEFKNYTDTLLGINRKEVESMYEKGDILNIKR